MMKPPQARQPAVRRAPRFHCFRLRFQNPFHRFQQILRDELWLPQPMPAPRFVFFAPEAGHHQHAARARRVPGFDIAITVSDDETFAEIEVEILRRAFDQSWPGFPAIATQRRMSEVGMVDTTIDRVETRSLRLQRIFHQFVDLPEEFFGEMAARDARLIGDDDGSPSRLVDQAHGLSRKAE